jgi:uroporphyrinogen-III synthase
MPTLLLTRPRAQSTAFAEALEAALPGRFRVVVSPLLDIVPRRAAIDLAGIARLAFTSANGVAAFAEACEERGLPAFCVGESTAEAARAIGLEAIAAEGDLGSLAELLARTGSGPVLHLRGARAAGDLAALLARTGVAARAAVLYDQHALKPSTEAEALGRAGGLEVLATFSPRSARLLAEAAAGWDLSRAATVAISAAADAPLAALAPARRVVAPEPSRGGMIEALAALG